MIEHFKGEEVFVKKVLEFKDQALYKQRLVLTKFLNPYHQSIVYSIVGNQNDLIVIEDGGMVDSEMKRLIIAPSFYQIEKEDFEIVLAKISYAKIYEYVKNNLIKIKRSKVKILESEEIITIKHQYISKTFIVSSFRLDKVVSTLYGVPRSKAVSYIQSGFVKVNHKEVEEINYLCNNSDIISLRRHGRVKFVDTKRRTKQDNYVVEGYFYK